MQQSSINAPSAQRSRPPPFYRRGQNNNKGQPIHEQRAPLVQIPNEFYAKLLNFLADKYDQRITRRGNTLYTVNDFLPVADIRSPQVVSIYVTDSASGRENKFDAKIEDLEIPAPIEVPREFYGYLRRYVSSVANAETWRRRNRFYSAADGSVVAEITSPDTLRVVVKAEGGGIFARTTTQEVKISELKPKRIVIPKELMFITKKLFGSYARWDRKSRMDARTAHSPQAIGIDPETAKSFLANNIRKSTTGLIEGEINYLLTAWAKDISNTRRARGRSTAKPFSSIGSSRIWIGAPPRQVPSVRVIETAEIRIDGEALTLEERFGVMSRLKLESGEEDCRQRPPYAQQPDSETNYVGRSIPYGGSAHFAEMEAAEETALPSF